jgi:RNA polymerase sigma-70 factor (ECF subfamily)
MGTGPHAEGAQLVAAEVDERALVAALRAGDEAAFAALVDRYSPSMIRVAQGYVRTRAVAEEVVQEAWLGVLKGLDRFEGRAALKTWIFRILVNTAKTRGEREARTVPFSSLASDEGGGPSVDPERFRDPSDAWGGHWAEPPERWETSPEHALLGAETRGVVDDVIKTLPAKQQQVVTLRDIEGWSSEEVCNVLGLSETNQRVLLHRARSKVRASLEDYMAGRGGQLDVSG